ncbi:response regulator transcription factor [Pseudogracilibacillus sp. SE30717A]|uniref:response regulator n=1 Tax=Pseudogracilibacillus sp. SE30717A TaxID=3098293 RepID=UPI00300DDE68
MNSKIKIVLLDNVKLFREGIKQILESDSTIYVAADGDENERVYQHLHKHKPDILLMEEEIVQKKQLHHDYNILKNFPSTKLVILTLHKKNYNEDHSYLTNKINGYLLKDMSATELIKTIKQIHSGFEFSY